MRWFYEYVFQECDGPDQAPLSVMLPFDAGLCMSGVMFTTHRLSNEALYSHHTRPDVQSR